MQTSSFVHTHTHICAAFGQEGCNADLE